MMCDTHMHRILGARSQLAPATCTMPTNEEKIHAYKQLTDLERLETLNASIGRATLWFTNTSRTFAEALDILRPTPPVPPGGESSKTKVVSKKERKMRPLAQVTLNSDWMDAVVATHRSEFTRVVGDGVRGRLYQYLVGNRYEPVNCETSERVTDDFHLNCILQPSACIAGGLLNLSRLKAGFAPQQNSTVGDLMVFLDTSDAAPKPYCVVENKKCLVFLTHEKGFFKITSYARFPWPTTPHGFDIASLALRMWIQV